MSRRKTANPRPKEANDVKRGLCRNVAARSLVWTALVCFVSIPEAKAQERQTPPPPFKLNAVKAMLFFEQTGEFSPDVSNEPASALRNRRAGAGGRATATLVVLEVSGQAGAYAPQRRLSFTATDSRKTILLRKTAELGIFSDEGKFYVAFWLYDTGCYPVTLYARLIGQHPTSTIKKTLNFSCGD
jgi:hypothetical protein